MRHVSDRISLDGDHRVEVVDEELIDSLIDLLRGPEWRRRLKRDDEIETRRLQFFDFAHRVPDDGLDLWDVTGERRWSAKGHLASILLRDAGDLIVVRRDDDPIDVAALLGLEQACVPRAEFRRAS